MWFKTETQEERKQELFTLEFYIYILLKLILMNKNDNHSLQLHNSLNEDMKVPCS